MPDVAAGTSKLNLTVILVPPLTILLLNQDR
jgi:hypothetical protein